MVNNWSAEQFRDEIIGAGRFAAVEFYNGSSPVPCSFGSELEAVAESFGESLLFGKVDVAKAEAIAEKYAIRSVPTFMVFCRGRGVGEVVGGADRTALTRAIYSAMDRVGGKNEKS